MRHFLCYNEFMLADEIKAFFKGEVWTDDATRTIYSHDASIFEVKPEIVVAPKDVEDIKKLVKFVSAQKEAGQNISLTARAAGTDMSGGPLTESIVVDFTKHINRLKEIDATHAVLEPGMYYRDFEKETDKLGVMMPSYPASKGLCAVGGMVANNAGGEKTLRYGKTEQYITKLKVILHDGEEYVIEPLNETQLAQKLQLQNAEGELYRKFVALIKDNNEIIKAAKPNVSKNSAGYYLWNVWDKERQIFDLPKLFVGSQGTLGFVTEITFRLVPKTRHSRMVVMFLKDLRPLAEVISEVLKHRPESFEAYDDKTLKLAFRFVPDLIKIWGFRSLSIAFQFLPDLWTILTRGMPKLVLLAQFAHNDERVLEEEINQVRSSLAQFPITVHATLDEHEEEKYWTIRRESFNLLRKHVKNKHTAPFIDDIIVHPEYLPEFLPKLTAILDEYKGILTSTLAGHVGDGNFHIIPLMNFKDERARAAIPEIADRVYDLVLSYKGSITAEHNDGLIRSPYLQKMYGTAIIRLFEETKAIFDPLLIFNPGKKVKATLEYAVGHVRKD